jgi:hypothetical protein
VDLRHISLSRRERAFLSAVFLVASLIAVWRVHTVMDTFGLPCVYGTGQTSAACVNLGLSKEHPFYYADLLEFELTLCLIVPGVFLAAFVFYPELFSIVEECRPRWKDIHTAAALAVSCGGFTAFILNYGRRQFGGADFSVLIDSGWRLVQGQVPYRDFFTTLPPGFYLGIKYAFLAFGVSWQAILWAAALYACGTFLWIYHLLAEILESGPIAFFGAIVIECAAMLTVSYWWYNNVTMIAATVFFLSCLLYIKKETGLWPQVSYVASLAMLGTMKPNVAFLTAAAGVVFSFFAVSRKGRLLMLTVLAIGANVAGMAANHVNAAGLIGSYLVAAAGRGFTTIGFQIMNGPDQVRFVICALFLASPLVVWRPQLLAALGHAKYREVARLLLLLCGPLISVFAVSTNMEWQDVDWPIFIAFGLVLFGVTWPHNQSRWARPYFCFLLALAISGLYVGEMRYRVRLVGDFYTPRGELVTPDAPFFRNMQVGTVVSDGAAQTQKVLARCARPVFFGPRMEYGYAAFGLPSPMHLPVWWHPGTSFALKDEPAIRKTWRDQCFATLIFSKNDATNYSTEFKQELAALYQRYEAASAITVFRRQPGTGCQESEKTAPRSP